MSAEQWYAALLSEAGRELGQRAQFLAYWKQNSDIGPMQRFFGALRDLALPQSSQSLPSSPPLAVFVDEIDVTLSLPFSTDEFFAAIRQCYVERAANPNLKSLVFCLLGTAAPADLIQDTRTSPFNIGRRIEVNDFTVEEAAPLARGLGEKGDVLLGRVLYWTGGHPYLTQRLCRAAAENAAQSPTDVDRLCADLFLTHRAKESDDNLALVRNRLLKSEVDLASLLDLYRKLRTGRRVADDETNPLCGLLKLSGVVQASGGLLKVRNRIYGRVFDKEWVTAYMPDAELRRQRAAYRRGVLQAGGIAGVVLLIVASLGVFAYGNYRLARAQTRLANQKIEEARISADRADDNLYVANMNLIQREWDSANVGHMVDLLEATRARGHGTFEWGYWHRLCHLDLLTLKGHTDPVYSVAYSPDGKRVVTGSYDKTAKVWDAQTGKELLTLNGHMNWVSSVAFSPDGRRIVTGSRDDTAKIWLADDTR